MGKNNNGGAIGGLQRGLFGDGGASAAGNAAIQQQRVAQQSFNKVTGIADQTTTAGLASFDQALSAQEKNLSRQEQLISQIDPTIVEASQQALRLLRGESSSTLAPVQAQRDQQRQKLLNSLRQQLGPGAETSSAGMQALTRFDSETNQLMASQQQSALQGLGQTFGQFSSQKPNIGQEVSTFGNLASARAGLGYQQAGLYQQAYQPVIGNAGANQVANVARGQAASAFGSQLLAAGGQIGAAVATGGASAAVPKPAGG